MGSPRQVEAREARSNALIEEFRKSQTPPPNTPAAELTDPPPATAPVPQPAPEPQLREDWKAKYLVLKGKYDAEVPRQAAEIAGLKELTRTLEQRIAQLQQSAPGTPPANTQTIVTDQDRERFDPDLLQVMERVAHSAASSAVEPLRKPVEESQAERAARERATQETERRDRFIDDLEDLVPEWVSLDKEPGFHAYLAETDEATGKQRQELLGARVAAHDVVGTARIFNGYLRNRPAPPPPTKSRIEEQLVPEVSGRASAPRSDARIWTRAEVNKFYTDIARRRITDPAEIKKTEQEIDVAQREGRIR